MITPQDLFTLLSDQTRLRCLLLLSNKQELCVCEFSHVLGSFQPKISRHLAYLRKSGLVLDERRGQWVYYRINNDLQKWIKELLSTIFNELKNSKPYCFDLEKIGEFRNTNPCFS